MSPDGYTADVDLWIDGWFIPKEYKSKISAPDWVLKLLGLSTKASHIQESFRYHDYVYDHEGINPLNGEKTYRSDCEDVFFNLLLKHEPLWKCIILVTFTYFGGFFYWMEF